jgi:hypothetical protein
VTKNLPSGFISWGFAQGSQQMMERLQDDVCVDTIYFMQIPKIPFDDDV